MGNITATGKGNLGFKTAAGGQVDLAGVDIAIGGKLTTNMGYGTFGHLTAGSMDLSASGIEFALSGPRRQAAFSTLTPPRPPWDP